MKLENNWLQKTLENLEKRNIDKPIHESYLVKRCYELYKVPLEEFTTEDLRIMIGQQIGLEYLIPLAFETLKENLFAEGDYYEGDLLKNILEIHTSFWDKNKEHWQTFNELIVDRRDEIKKAKFETINFDNSQYKDVSS
jgi:hypothetical protein